MVIREEVHSDTYWSVTVDLLWGLARYKGLAIYWRLAIPSFNTFISEWMPRLPKAVWRARLLGRDRGSGRRQQLVLARGLWPKAMKAEQVWLSKDCSHCCPVQPARNKSTSSYRAEASAEEGGSNPTYAGALQQLHTGTRVCWKIMYLQVS